MMKHYVKPAATTVAFAMSENIAASAATNTGHIGYVNDLMIDDGSCNEYMANTGLPSGIIGEVENFEHLVGALMNMYDVIGEKKFMEIAEMIDSGTFNCWKE